MRTLRALFGEEAAILRKTDFQFLLVAALLPVLGLAIVSPILDSLIGPFGTNTANIGLLVSVYTAPPVVLIPVAGVLADRYGRKHVLIGAILLYGAAGTAIALTTDFCAVLALRFLQGVGFAGISPIIITSIGDLYSGDEEATGQGIRFMVSAFSAAIFPLFAGVLVVVAWQYPFLLYAMSFPIALGLALRFEEPSSSAGAPATDGGVDASYRAALFGLARTPRVLAILVARGLMMPMWIGFVTYNSLIVLRLLDGTPFQAGILVAVGYFGMGIAGSQAGRITALADSRLLPLLAGNGSLGGGFALVLFAPGIGIATVGIAAAGVGMGILGTLYRSIITGFAPTQLRAGLVGLSEAGSRIAITLTPVLMGGIIGLTSPTLGFTRALRSAGLVVIVVAGGGTVVCLLVANASAPVSVD